MLTPLRHEDGRDKIDTRIYDINDRVFMDMFMSHGDAMSLSLSTAEDLWHKLTMELSMLSLLGLEVCVEAAIILFTSLLLYVADPDSSFSSKLLVSLSAVRLSTDAIFGWAEGPKSSDFEVVVLLATSWIHWLLLNIASAVIVSRALRPLRQVIFAPDVVINDTHIVLRMQVIRPGHVSLSNVNLTLVGVTRTGAWKNLDMEMSMLPTWSGAGPFSVKHKLTEESRAFVNPETLGNLMISMSAVDNYGCAVNANMRYARAADRAGSAGRANVGGGSDRKRRERERERRERGERGERCGRSERERRERTWVSASSLKLLELFTLRRHTYSVADRLAP